MGKEAMGKKLWRSQNSFQWQLDAGESLAPRIWVLGHGGDSNQVLARPQPCFGAAQELPRGQEEAAATSSHPPHAPIGAAAALGTGAHSPQGVSGVFSECR